MWRRGAAARALAPAPLCEQPLACARLDKPGEKAHGMYAVMTALRVLIADDDSLFREVLRARLNHPRIEVVGEAENGEDALRLVEALRPDVLVMDVHMPVLDGLSAAAQLIDAPAGLRVVILSGEPDLFTAARAEAVGAGYRRKDEVADDFAAHILGGAQM